MATPAESFPAPIFVGGPGRSGTHPVGRLLAADPRYHLIRTEARFHCVQGGLPDLLAGRTTVEDFVERCRGRWWQRGMRQGQGLQRLVDRGQLEAALEAFAARFEADSLEASRELVGALFDPPARRDGKPAWIELTGQVIESAPTLLRLFPRARFINMVRDGRAVAAGMVRKTDMTDDPMRALDKWEEMVRASDAAMREVPVHAVLVLQLDDLVARDRERSFARLVEFLEIDDPAPMRTYFDTEISAERAHFEGWRERLPPPDVRRIDRRYRRLVRTLHREGVWWAPAPENGGLRLGPLRIPTPARQ